MAMAPTSRAARQGHPRHRRVGNHAADGAGGEEADVNADEAGNGNSSGATTMQSKPWPKFPGAFRLVSQPWTWLSVPAFDDVGAK
jgi:hypothetical protein